MTVPASSYDLTTVADVKAWMGGPGAGGDDQLQKLITNCSRFILSYISRATILPHTVTERRDGNGHSLLMLREWPVLAVSALMVGTSVVPAATAPTPANPACPSGYLVELWDGRPPGSMQALDLFGYGFWKGRQNVQVTYTAGYQVTGEAGTIPINPGPYTVTVAGPYGPWAVDAGVTIAGVAAVKVASAPAAGQYTAAAGVYTFAAANAGLAVAISYGFIPTDLAQACIELVAEKSQYAQRIGMRSKSLGGQETVSFAITDITDAVKLMLQNYTSVFEP